MVWLINYNLRVTDSGFTMGVSLHTKYQRRGRVIMIVYCRYGSDDAMVLYVRLCA